MPARSTEVPHSVGAGGASLELFQLSGFPCARWSGAARSGPLRFTWFPVMFAWSPVIRAFLSRLGCLWTLFLCYLWDSSFEADFGVCFRISGARSGRRLYEVSGNFANIFVLHVSRTNKNENLPFGMPDLALAGIEPPLFFRFHGHVALCVSLSFVAVKASCLQNESFSPFLFLRFLV